MNSLIDPVEKAANAFINVWRALPQPFTALFSVGLVLCILYALYQLLSR